MGSSSEIDNERAWKVVWSMRAAPDAARDGRGNQ
jgi:hypothetical protein